MFAFFFLSLRQKYAIVLLFVLFFRGYWARVTAFDQIILNFLESNLSVTDSNGNVIKKQIVSLGAGIDTSFWRLCNSHASVFKQHLHKFYEMDFLETTIRKIHLFTSNIENEKLFLQNKDFLDINNKSEHNVVINKKEGTINSKYYALIPGDMCQWSKLEAKYFKRDVNNDSTNKNDEFVDLDFSFDRPTLFLSECVLIYMPVSKSKHIIDWIAKNFHNGAAFALYEQILPNDAFGKQMIKNLGLFDI